MIIIKRSDMSCKDIERFWAKVCKSDGCWVWQASTDRYGYGQIAFAGTMVRAHRFSYALAHGECPTNLQVDHRCRNRLCVNPAHLQVVDPPTNKENLGESYKNSCTGIRGVSGHRARNKYQVQVTSRGRHYFGGYYVDIHEAEKAAIELRNKLMTNNLLDRAKRGQQ